MPQKRLDIFARKVGLEEIDHADRIRQLKLEAKETRRAISDKKAELNRRRKKQKESGLELGEVQVTDQVIEKVLLPYRKNLKRLGRDILKLEQQSGEVQKAGASQRDMFGE